MYSMLSNLEREYLHTFALKKYAGQGAIVDLGCWLGSSTIALASGVASTRIYDCGQPLSTRTIYLSGTPG
jgi:predicted O-methyltransferase YrrM